MPTRILLAEDDEAQRSVLKAVLESGGYEVDQMGFAAVWKIHEGHYDSCFMTIHCPRSMG